MTLALLALGLPCLILAGFAIETFLGVRRLTRKNSDLIPLPGKQTSPGSKQKPQ